MYKLCVCVTVLTMMGAYRVEQSILLVFDKRCLLLAFSIANSAIHRESIGDR
jgi:hypothetical protein